MERRSIEWATFMLGDAPRFNWIEQHFPPKSPSRTAFTCPHLIHIPPRPMRRRSPTARVVAAARGDEWRGGAGALP